MKFANSICACARWEEDEIVEWVEYHRSIGFDHIYLYSNDDDPLVLYRRLLPYILGESPYMTFLHCPTPGGQIEIYLHFLRNFKDESKWVTFLDIDEFYILPGIDSIKQFMSHFEGIADCVYFNWLVFGNSGKKVRDNESVLVSLNRRAASVDVHTKTIFRTEAVSEQLARGATSNLGFPTHFWHGYPSSEFRICNVLGDSIPDYTDNFPVSAHAYLTKDNKSEQILARGYIAHYKLKSEHDFIRRAERGRLFGHKAYREQYNSGEYLNILERFNVVEDNYQKEFWTKRTAGTIKHCAAPESL